MITFSILDLWNTLHMSSDFVGLKAGSISSNSFIYTQAICFIWPTCATPHTIAMHADADSNISFVTSIKLDGKVE